MSAALRIRFYSPQKSFQEARVTKEQAVALAAKERAKTLDWEPAAEHFSDQVLAKIPFAVDLRIVNANHMRTKLSNLEAARLVFNGDAKPAWVVRYRGTEKNPLPDVMMASTQLDIWIDVLTGEYLGGRF